MTLDTVPTRRPLGTPLRLPLGVVETPAQEVPTDRPSRALALRATSEWDSQHHPGIRPCPCDCHETGVVDDVRVNPECWSAGDFIGCAHAGCE